MRIQNNIMALNTHRQLGINQLNQQKSTEKLSSGFKINRAADDAAGLSISEKMRAQIRGLNRAAQNSQDGISLIQSAEGALQEAHSVLQRMRELAIQGSNDVNAPEDRVAIMDEIEQLAKEIDRIGDTTNFNGKYILNGTYENVSLEDVATRVLNENFYGNFLPGGEQPAGDKPLSLQVGANALFGDVVNVFINGINAVNVLNTDGEGIWDPGDDYGELGKLVREADGTVPSPNAEALENYGVSGYVELTAGGDELPIWNINAFHALVNKLDGLDETGVSNPDAYPTGLNLISKMRSELGALQNRLEHTLSNVQTIAENVQAAESRIRDVDMAEEMMNFTKQNILNQAATAMLAQANMVPQTVLQLLQ